MTDRLDDLKAALADRYRIERELGAGGMATVYLAHDVRHERKVALKVLRPELAAVIGAERFLAEIKTTANLQHPHILPLFDSGEVDSFLFYVMPFVEGESLRERLDREKQLPVDEAVRIASETASALDYAHRRGIVHRDIKPENVLLHDGQALVADFGIALAASKAGGTRMTETGMSLGTPHYMSPEQAMGERDLDARSDVYALGCVLYEMLASEPPFTGPTAQAVVAKVMTAPPEPVTSYRPTTPPHVAQAVQTALEKLPADRFASAAEFAAAMERPGTISAPAVAVSKRSWGMGTVAGALALAVGALAIGWFLGSRGRPSSRTTPPSRLAILAPKVGGSGGAVENRWLSITRDGSALVYVREEEGAGNQIVWHDLDADQPVPIPGVVGRYAPRVSPDGRWVITTGTAGERDVPRRISVTSGSETVIRSASFGFGNTLRSTWHTDGSAWFSLRNARAILRLDADSDTAIVRFEGQQGLILQQIMDDGRSGLVVRSPIGTSSGPAVWIDLETGATKPLIDFPVVEIRYTSGYLVFVLPDGTMQAVAFDRSSRTVTGSPVTIADNVSLTGSGIAQFDVSATGTVVYIPEEPRSLVVVDRSGRVGPLTPARQNYHSPVFSPSGRQVAVDFTSSDGRDVWMLDLDQQTLTRVTFARDGHDPTWSRDGRFITYTSTASGTFGVYRTRAGAGGGSPGLVAENANLGFTGYWMDDDTTLLTVGNGLVDGSQNDVALLRPGQEPELVPVVATPYQEQFPTLSPDGKWLAFVSNLSGDREVYLRPLDDDRDQIQVSIDGGAEPAWNPNGRELFYRHVVEDQTVLVAAQIETTPRLRVTSRTTLFPVSQMASSNPHRNYDVSPDGQSFVMVQRSLAGRIVVLQQLPELVRRASGD